MSEAIKTREELFLAKIAGYDIDIKDMFPGVPISTEEKLMLEIADRIDDLAGAAGSPAAATPDKAGAVKMAVNVPEAAGSAPTAAEFNAVIDALIDAGIMATS